MDNRKMIITIIIIIVVALMLLAIYNYWEKNKNLPDFDCSQITTPDLAQACSSLKSQCGTDQKCKNAISACLPIVEPIRDSITKNCPDGIGKITCDIDAILSDIDKTSYEECGYRISKVDSATFSKVLEYLGLDGFGKITKESLPKLKEILKTIDGVENSLLPALISYWETNPPSSSY